MWSTSRARLAVLLSVIVLATTSGARAGETGDEVNADPRALVAQAAERWELYHDPNGALQLLNRAVELTEGEAWVLLRRANFLETVSGVATADQVEQLKEAARADYRTVAAADPDSVTAGVARDGLARLDSRQLLPLATVTCPAAAVEAFKAAERMFNTGRFDEAIAHYERATAECPGQAAFWRCYADAFYSSGRYEPARDLFLKALDVEPWDRSTHRFLADTEARLGNTDAALSQVALAVVSDPTYEAAWATLRSFAFGSGRSYLRVYGEKATVSEEATEGRHRNVTISLPMPPGDSSPAQAAASEDDEETSPGADQEAPGNADDDPEPMTDLVGWAIYATLKALPLPEAAADEGTTAEQSADAAAPSPARLSPFELERKAVTAVLEGLTPGPESPFWSMLDRAQAAGFVDEAIYLHLLDENLVEEFRAFRDAHADRLVDYLLTVVVPARQSANAEPLG